MNTLEELKQIANHPKLEADAINAVETMISNGQEPAENITRMKTYLKKNVGWIIKDIVLDRILQLAIVLTAERINNIAMEKP